MEQDDLHNKGSKYFKKVNVTGCEIYITRDPGVI